MATELRKAAWRVPLPTLAQRLVLLLLCDLPRRDTAECSPSRATIKQRTGLDDDGLRAALVALKERSLVTWERRAETSNLYRINVENLMAQQAQVLSTGPKGQR